MRTATKFILQSVMIYCLFIFSSCTKDNPSDKSGSLIGSLTNGVFISCEGQFGASGEPGSVSFYDRNSGQVYNDMFRQVNGYPLGSIVQSVTIFNDKAYIPVNNSGKMAVVNAVDFKSEAVVANLEMPRYFLGIDNSKGYLSQWGMFGAAGSVKVIDLITNTVTSTISTGKGADHMVMLGNKVYVACSGGFDVDSVVTVIDVASNTVLSNIVVGTNPSYIQVDANGKIWVLCIGVWNSSYTALAQTGKLVRIDPNTNTVDLSLTFTSTFSQPGSMVINTAKNTIYYTYQSGVYAHDINSSVLSVSPNLNRSFYGLGVDPLTDYLYCTDPGFYQNGGWVVRYTSALTKIDSFQVGIGPGNFFFK